MPKTWFQEHNWDPVFALYEQETTPIWDPQLSPFMHMKLLSPGIHSCLPFFSQETTPTWDPQLSGIIHK